MRRRIVEVNKAEVGRFRHRAQPAVSAPTDRLGATLGERAVARQVQGQTGRRIDLVVIDDPIKQAP